MNEAHGGVTAADMKSCQINAGRSPPNCACPCTSVIETSVFGYPIQTAVVRLGVKPSSQASTRLLVVPVFAALGQPIAESVAVPYCTLCWRTSLSTAAAPV